MSSKSNFKSEILSQEVLEITFGGLIQRTVASADPSAS